MEYLPTIAAIILFSIGKAVGLGSKSSGALFNIISSVVLFALVMGFVSTGKYIANPIYILLLIIILVVEVRTFVRIIKRGPVSLPGAKLLDNICEIKLIYEKSQAGTPVTYLVLLNNKSVGKLNVGKSITAQTKFAQNMLVMEAKDAPDQNVEPLYFSVESGEPAEIYFSSGKYMQNKFTGCKIMTPKEVKSLSESAN